VEQRSLPAADLPPTLIMADEDDQLIPPANSHFLHNAIPGSQLEMFRGGGHLFMLSDPVSFGIACARFWMPPPARADRTRRFPFPRRALASRKTSRTSAGE
jgi:pimeloyl-ACP methyl ester carboxylesterase